MSATRVGKLAALHTLGERHNTSDYDVKTDLEFTVTEKQILVSKELNVNHPLNRMYNGSLCT